MNYPSKFKVFNGSAASVQEELNAWAEKEQPYVVHTSASVSDAYGLVVVVTYSLVPPAHEVT